MKTKFVEDVSQKELYDSPNPLVRHVHRKRLEKIIELIGDTTGKTVLDIGCGEGYFLERLNGKLIGIDYSEKKLKEAKKRLKKAKLIKGDAKKLPFKDNSIDVFIVSEVLEHIDGAKEVAKEIIRTAKDNAIVVISAPNENNWQIARLLLLRFPLRLEGHVNKISPKTLEDWFETKAEKKYNIPNLPFLFCLTHIHKFKIKKEKIHPTKE
jgi:ubiquinone/menaquinone biosynthesis C-methylase UbiE